jgi:hypothetical protein
VSKYGKPRPAFESPCPHPGCDVPLRFVFNRRANKLTAYHGEDALVDMQLDPAQAVNDGRALHAVLWELTAQGGEEYAGLTKALGVSIALQVADLHVRMGV